MLNVFFKILKVTGPPQGAQCLLAAFIWGPPAPKSGLRMRAFPMDAQAYVGVGAPIRADYYVVSPHNLRGPSGPA